MKITMWIIGSVFGLALIFMGADCCSGHTKRFEANVISHHYVAAWTETSVSTDSDGHTTVDTTYHPEEFHVICGEAGGEQRTFDVSTTRGTYYSVTNDQEVTVIARIGKWSKAAYLPTIEP